ncbi:thioredoxin family protein [Shewanella salipaludis]
MYHPQSDKSGLSKAAVIYEGIAVILTGKIPSTQLAGQLPGFDSEYLAYQPDMATLAPLSQLGGAIEIVAIIGTWCPDCHRELPRFIRVLEAIDNPNIRASYIGIDRAKQDPQGLAAAYDFARIPTFIVRQDGEEMGRIVERPEISLERDLAGILRSA